MPSSKTIDRIRQLQEWKKQRAKKEVDKINKRNTPRKDLLRKQKEAVASPTMRNLKLYSKIGEERMVNEINNNNNNTPTRRRKFSNLKRTSLLGSTPKANLLKSETKKKMSSPFALRTSQTSNTPTRLRSAKKSAETTRNHERTTSKENLTTNNKLTGVVKNTKNRRRRKSRRNRKRRMTEDKSMKSQSKGRRRSMSLQDSVQSFRDEEEQKDEEEEEEIERLDMLIPTRQDKISPAQAKSRGGDLKMYTSPIAALRGDEKVRLNTPVSREQEDEATSPVSHNSTDEITKSSMKAPQQKKWKRDVPQSRVCVDEKPEYSKPLEANVSPTTKVFGSKVSKVVSAESMIFGEKETDKRVQVEPSAWGLLSSAISTLSPTNWFGKAYEVGVRQTVTLDRLEASTPQSTRTVDDGSVLFEYDSDHAGSPTILPASSVSRSRSTDVVSPESSSLPATLHESHEPMISALTSSPDNTSRVLTSIKTVTTKVSMSSPMSADTPKRVHDGTHVLNQENEDQNTQLASPEVIPENHGTRRARFDRVREMSTSSKISVASPRTSIEPVLGGGHADKMERHRTSISSRVNATSPTEKASHSKPAIVSQSESCLTSSSCVEQDEIEESLTKKTLRKQHLSKISPQNQDEKVDLDDPVTPMYVSPPWLPTSKVSPTDNTSSRQDKSSNIAPDRASSPKIVHPTIQTMNAELESKSEDHIGVTSVHEKSSRDVMRTPASVCEPVSLHEPVIRLTTTDNEMREEPSFEHTPSFKCPSMKDMRLDITTHAKRSTLNTPSSIVSEVMLDEEEKENDILLSKGELQHRSSAKKIQRRSEVVSLPTRKDLVRALHARHRSSMRSSVENCTACSACIIV